MKYNITDAMKDLLTGNLELAPPETVKARLAICDTCEAKNKILHVCTACGCFLPMKTKLTKSVCPFELW